VGDDAKGRFGAIVRSNGPVTRNDDGTYYLSVEGSDRDVLNDLFGQFREVLMDGQDSETVKRLFPTAYHQDPQHDEEYQRLMRTELLTSHVHSIDHVRQLFQQSSNAETIMLSQPDLDALMKATNGIRLLLGTMLAVSEDDHDDIDESDPTFGQHQLYAYLGWLLDWMVTAQAGVFPVTDNSPG
jgi:hypothetical protein